MSEFHSSEEERAKAEEARAAFKGYIDYVGAETVGDALRAAEKNMNEGKNGVSIVDEKHSSMLVIDEDGVSFSVKEFGGFVIPIDTAKAALWEVQLEKADKPTSS